jgi:large subunit ribosomal protein L22
MKIIAKLNHLRIAPRKVRMVADIIRGRDVKEAEVQLKFLARRAAEPLLKLLNSAIANALHNFGIEKDNLYISELQINEGPPLKRWMPRAMGRSAQILKRTSHIILVLETKKDVKVKKPKKIKPEVVKLKAGEEIKNEPVSTPVGAAEGEGKPVTKPKPALPQKPHPASGKERGRFFSRQTFGNAKKLFRRKSF